MRENDVCDRKVKKGNISCSVAAVGVDVIAGRVVDDNPTVHPKCHSTSTYPQTHHPWAAGAVRRAKRALRGSRELRSTIRPASNERLTSTGRHSQSIVYQIRGRWSRVMRRLRHRSLHDRRRRRGIGGRITRRTRLRRVVMMS